MQWIKGDDESMTKYLQQVLVVNPLCTSGAVLRLLRFYKSRKVQLQSPSNSFLDSWKECQRYDVIKFIVGMGVVPDTTGLFLEQTSLCKQALRAIGFK